MNFSNYLKKRQIDFDYKTIKEHFEALGGQLELGITIRYFQQIVNGERPPTERILASIFSRTQPSEKKLIVIAYFKSTLESTKSTKELLAYLEGHLNHAIESSSSGFWKNDIQPHILNEEQLKFLITDRDILKAHNKILLFEKVLQKSIDKNTLQKLIACKLVRIIENNVVPFNRYMIIPSMKNSDHHLSSLGTQYMMKVLDTFLSKEGHLRQKAETFCFLVPKESADKILLEIGNFIEWAKRFAKDAPIKSNSNLVPFYVSLFAKEIEDRDL